MQARVERSGRKGLQFWMRTAALVHRTAVMETMFVLIVEVAHPALVLKSLDTCPSIKQARHLPSNQTSELEMTPRCRAAS